MELTMKKLLTGLIGITLVLTSVLIINTITFAPTVHNSVTGRLVDVDAQRVASNLSRAIQFRTVSSQLKSQPEHEEFERFLHWLAETYPEVYQNLRPQQVGKYSMLFTWQGADATLQPILMSGHYDVVPVQPGTDNLWNHEPYSGHVDQKYIWGRGAMDDKNFVIAMMEAVTMLLGDGYQPERTVYLALTHDEETGGLKGTTAVVEKLKQDNVRLAWTLDEGSFLIQGIMPGVEAPIASINVAEKGGLTVNIVARGEGGHSSMPPRETAVDILAKALLKLKQAPVPGGLEGESGVFFDAVARHMPFEKRLLFANRWLFDSVIESILSAMPSSNAMLRTTTAPTMLTASSKVNVLASEAIGTVNFRLHPRDSVESVMSYIESVIDDDRVEVEVLRGRPASGVSSSESVGFNKIADAARSTFDEIIVTPGLTVAGTDSHHYEELADNLYRFNPIVAKPEDLKRLHGVNERVSIDNMTKATKFFNLLIREGSSG
jgi:carboxypeptidase PM20D1